MGDGVENQSLLGDKLCKTTPWRWYILFTFSFLSFTQSLVWFTFSSAPTEVKAYYPGMTDATIDLLLNWGSIVFLVVQPFISLLAARPNGFRISYWMGACFTFFGAVIRTIPCWLGPEFRSSTLGFVLLHTGQILNGADGPIVMALCSHLAVIWFPDNQRSTATAIAFTANTLGTAAGFLVGPNIATTPDRIPLLLYGEMAWAAIPILLGLIYFPNAPPHPPSAIALSYTLTTKDQGPTFLEGLRACLRDWSGAIVIVAGGAAAGLASGWQGVLPQLFSEELGYSDAKGANLGFATTIGTIAGGILVGPLMDTIFRRRFKRALLFVFSLCLMVLVWFTLMMPMPWAPAVLPAQYAVLMLSISFMGILQGALSPFFIELSAELTYPVPEATSGGLFVWFFNLFTLTFLFVQPTLPLAYANTLQTGVFALCILFVLLIKEQYKRGDAEAKLGMKTNG